jgi:toxin-antitoxin system PIN domain toxin
MNGSQAIGIPWIVVTGFVRITTTPRATLNPIDPGDAFDIVEEWFIFPHVRQLNPGSHHLRIFREAVGLAGIGGNLVTDSHIAAIALEYDAVVHSNDSDFSRFPGLKWLNPLKR